MPTASPIPYRVRRSTRARRVRVVVHPDATVEVVLPARARERDAAEAMRQLDDWVTRRLAEVRSQARRTAPPAGTVPYLGTLLTLVPEAGRTQVHGQGLRLWVPAGDPRPALERWYRRRAREEIAPRLDEAAAAVGRTYTTLAVRNQRTRWGSCSSSGAMSFNWRLLLAPPAVLDYVVWHEACHLVHLDHSPRFWALVATHRPAYREQQRWLTRNGAGLQLPAF
ncbi:MAG: family metallopeptidase [Solirubrobacterales bacterium]|nr:family metallopeptidase [Solirubrobacterales bacterium]